ncbi:hypothetical protein QFC22_005147 [Naganishia vaughanmartiniae]|uniref:Uncharacterized protein n=1 Tax=Naganishia vaughanmartiniae TaxID=1424756 RepID=A0ACC2WWH8_9TREE|nr:hypothetical protein QFC22_005147 [Naganishia vaughanmartiniae]
MERSTSKSTGDPKLPLELLSLIGCFVAGTNSYASLANFSLACHSIHEELKRTLYETVILDANKYLMIDDRLHGKLHDKFPNLKVVVTLSVSTEDDEHPGLLACSLKVLQSVNVATLSSLLQIPLHWQSPEEDEFEDEFADEPTDGIQEAMYEPIGSIQHVTVADATWIAGHFPAENNGNWLSKGNGYPLRTTFVFDHQRPSEDLRRTLVNILWLTLSIVDQPRNLDCYFELSENYEEPHFRFQSSGGGFPVADLFIETLGLPLTKMCPHITIDVGLKDTSRRVSTQEEKDIAKKELKQHISKAAGIYHGIWSHMAKHASENWFNSGEPFYSIICDYGSKRTHYEFWATAARKAFELGTVNVYKGQYGARQETTKKSLKWTSHGYSVERDGFKELFEGR